MGRRAWIFPLAIAACLALAVCARAQDMDDYSYGLTLDEMAGDWWDDCKNSDPDVSIRGCTAIIDAGTDTTKNIASAHYIRGVSQYNKDDYDRAIADYTKAIALNPKYAEAYGNRGMAFEMKGKKQKAAADCRKVLTLRPGNNVATAGLQRLAGSSANAATSATEDSFKHFANTDFAGVLLKKTPADSAAACEAQCQSNGKCAAFTFNVWNAACFLKSGVTAALLEPSSVSGLPAGAKPPPKSTAAKSMVRYRGRVFPGEPSSAGASASFVTCEARCEDDPHCVAFSYVKESSTCREFARAGEYSKDSGIDSGVKRQVGQ